MEKRFALFLILSALILFTHLTIQSLLFPPPPPQPPIELADGAGHEGEDAGHEGLEAQPTADGQQPAARNGATEPARLAAPDETGLSGEAAQGRSSPEIAPSVAVPQQWVTLGSMAADSPYRLLVTLNNQGAAVERIELVQRAANGQFRFQELEHPSGYLGYLAFRDEPDGRGCRINVVGQGTPAAAAVSQTPGIPAGLCVGDVIRRVGDLRIRDRFDVDAYLAQTQPGQHVSITVARTADDGQSRELTFDATLVTSPLSIVRPDQPIAASNDRTDPLSFLWALESIGHSAVPRDKDEIAKLPSLRRDNWQVRTLDDSPGGPGVEFTFALSEPQLQAIGVTGSLELVKRYRLARTPEAKLTDSAFPSYHVELELEIRNRGHTPQQLAYRLDGPNGLPLEGWWYVTKIHPRFSAAGARDVIWSTPSIGHGLIGATKIYSEAMAAREKKQPVIMPLFSGENSQPIDYAGVDAQYFSVVLQPHADEAASLPSFRQALAIPVGDVASIEKSMSKTTNVSFRLISSGVQLEPGQSLVNRYTIFAGPKQPALLRAYGLERCIEYGWFRTIAKFLAAILHAFESLPGVNYGLAIILLTVLVRSAMTPLSRKAARNAQMMQELAPEMKKIAEKYKDDMQKRAAAQSELFKKHNYRPLGGCLLMFIQLPIFIGLYRALSVDVELRQAPLISGLHWCSNLAGPDMLWYWKPYLPAFLGGESGWLGPYLNILPIITIVLFLWQQKMFMPPATDEQTRMQQSMMKYMMIFMGLLFFRVPAGLCLYFIASSLWSVAERKMLPPPGKRPDTAASPATQPFWQRMAAKFNPELDPAKSRARRRPPRKR